MSAARYLVLDLDAPLMSFGGPRIDGKASGYLLPSRAFVTGIIANACGWERSRVGDLQALQDGLEIACGVVRRGEMVVDYQTADLSKPHMGGPGNKTWTADGKRFAREGSPEALRGRRQQWRPYLANARILVAVWQVGFLPVTLTEAERALNEPCRFIYLGRNSCPPASDISLGLSDASSPQEAMAGKAGDAAIVEFSMPFHLADAPGADWTIERISGARNWRLDRHTGTQLVARMPNHRKVHQAR